MVSMVGFAQGFQQRGDELHRKRREMAQAFEQFRANNPYATAEDFQSFIDRVSGGRHFIRGGAPSAEILERIGAENQQRRARDEFNNRLSDLMDRQRAQQSLMSLADQSLLQMEGDDLIGAYESFRRQFGPDMEPIMGSLGVRDMFTPERVQSLRAGVMRENMPAVMDFMRANPQLANAPGAADAISMAFPHIPRPIIQSILDQARSQLQQEEADAQMARNREQAQVGLQIRQAVTQDPNLAELIRMNRRDEAMAIIRDIAQPFMDAQTPGMEFIDDEFLERIITQVAGGMGARQQAEYAARAAEAGVQGQQAVEAVLRESVDAANRHFAAGSDGAPSTLAGQAGPLGREAALILAQRYDLSTMSNPQAVDVLVELFQEPDAGAMTLQELVSEGARRLQEAGVTPMREAQDHARRMHPAMPARQSFEDWHTETRSQIGSGLSMLGERVAEIGQLSDPREMLDRIERERANMVRFQREVQAGLDMAQATQSVWLPVGMDAWDDTMVYGGGGSIMAEVTGQLQLLDTRLRAFERQALAIARAQAQAEAARAARRAQEADAADAAARAAQEAARAARPAAGSAPSAPSPYDSMMPRSPAEPPVSIRDALGTLGSDLRGMRDRVTLPPMPEMSMPEISVHRPATPGADRIVEQGRGLIGRIDDALTGNRIWDQGLGARLREGRQ